MFRHPLFYALVVFLAVWTHGILIEISDDEAYYWVLSQHLDWGYAYHPPAVAWWIALFGGNLRLASAVLAATLMGLALTWVKQQTLNWERWANGCFAVLWGAVGIFSLSWMMVPDLPLFLGWMLAFIGTTSWLDKRTNTARGWVAAGIIIAILSKYSGILIPISVIWALGWRRLKRSDWILLGVSTGVALAPVMYWNSQHEWASLLYQIKGRHGGGFSILRGIRFWTIQLALVGPALFWALFKLRSGGFGGSEYTNRWKFLAKWSAPAFTIYGMQPFFGEFKPHWMLIAWWPLILGLALMAPHIKWRPVLKLHIVYGWSVWIALWSLFYIPWLGWVGLSPLADVSNDLVGWRELPERVEKVVAEKLGHPMAGTAVVGSRYQTASQAAYAWRGRAEGTLLPRNPTLSNEWPDIGVSEGVGPEWPKLLRPVIFLADHRYRSGPEFKDAQCVTLGKFETYRFKILSKWIEAWWCEPIRSHKLDWENPDANY